MALYGDIPQAGGLSSSSSVVVATALAMSELGALPIGRSELAARCGEAEWYVGTRGGSGDQSAMLLGQRGGLTHLRFEAPFRVRDIIQTPFPEGYQLILANSQTRSEKSAEERLLFNAGIFAYRFAFLALKQAMRDLNLPPELIEETQSLGDLNTGRICPADLYSLLLDLPANASPHDLAERFPGTFASAARGCFGTDDPNRLPESIPLRGAALYGLGRADRGLVMPALLERGGMEAMAEFGRLMTITHDGDRRFLNGQPFTANRDGLSDGALEVELERPSGPTPLRELPGFYGASIAELDCMVDAALRTEGVLGAGLMGAGGGGYVLILARDGAFDSVRAALVRDYYTPCGKEPDMEIWHPTAAACRLA